jgi:hypothetical protein
MSPSFAGVGLGVMVSTGKGVGDKVAVGRGVSVGEGVMVGMGVGVEVGIGVDVDRGIGVIEGVGVDVGVGDGDGVGISAADGKPQPGEGVALSTKSLAWFVSSPAGWRSNECPSGTSRQGGDIMALSSP